MLSLVAKDIQQDPLSCPQVDSFANHMFGLSTTQKPLIVPNQVKYTNTIARVLAPQGPSAAAQRLSGHHTEPVQRPSQHEH